MLRVIILITIFLFVGCNRKSNKIDDHKSQKASCLVEEVKSGDIIMCFEGSKDYVKRKCIKRKKDAIVESPRVIYSEKNGCPIDRGYLGHCILDNGEYIPYYYADSKIFSDQKRKDIIKNSAINDCENGIWVSKEEE